MECSDGENNSDVEMIDDILGPEDLFIDEADEDGEDEQNNDQESKEKSKDSKDNKVEKRIKPKIVRRPRVTLNFDRLKGDNGLSAFKKLIQNFKFKGSGHEKEDLIKIMGILQQWMCYQLCPSFDFENCMLQLENLGKKRNIQVLMKKYRLGMDEWGENISIDEIKAVGDSNTETNENSNRNEFDLLLDEEMAKISSDDELIQNDGVETQNENHENNTLMSVEVTLTPEQLERIARNKKLAEERRLKRMSERCETEDENQKAEKIGHQDITLERINLNENN